MDSYWVEVPTQYMRIEEAVHSDGLATPPSDDYADFDAGGAAADSTVEELPEEFFKLTDAAIRGDLDLVKSIFESERLPNSPMERIDNNQFVPIMHKALVNGHVLVVVYFLSQGIPFNMVQIGIVVNYGLHSLLYV